MEEGEEYFYRKDTDRRIDSESKTVEKKKKNDI